MKKQYNSIIFIVSSVLFLLSFLFSCNKNDINAEFSDLSFSTDTLMFDTVFTTIGSSTRILKVYNTSNQDITITNIKVAGGTNSNFSINIDGLASNFVSDITIPSNDSIFIFAKVRIDPNNLSSPLVVEDSIVFNVDQNYKYIKLLAWGQDANYIVADKFVENLPPYKIVAKEGETVVWNSEKPYVIYGYAVVDSTATLEIAPGTKVYFHSKGGLWVYKGGSIKVYGTPENKVVFAGDRLEPEYKDVPGQWERIWLNEGSQNNEFYNVDIKNGFIGIQAETLDEPMGNFLILENVNIQNMSGMGIYSRRYGIIAGNCVISNCGNYLAALTQGGYYDFRHCTFANYWNKSFRDYPSVFISNYYLNNFDNTMYLSDLENAYFGNCIIFGSKDNELKIDDSQLQTMFNCLIDNCLVKAVETENDIKYINNCIFNQYPYFVDSLEYNFRLDTITSVAIDAGNLNIISDSPIIDLTNDLDNKNRLLDGKPDLGAYEFQKTY
ncbi:MAG: hypothetical protein ACOX4D_06965 [Bacteroidales bacterium]|jgi:hypothetical protein